MTYGHLVDFIIMAVGVALGFLLYLRFPHDPDGAGVDLFGQGREPEGETPTLTPEQRADRMEAFILEGIANYEREHGPGSSRARLQGTEPATRAESVSTAGEARPPQTPGSTAPQGPRKHAPADEPKAA